MADSLIVQRAIEEIEAKEFGVTEQFLQIHEIESRDGKPVVARVDKDSEDGTVIVYFPVKDEKFFLAIYLDTNTEVAVRWVGTEYYTSVYFKAFSETLSLNQLSEMTVMKHTSGRSKGEPRNPNGEGKIVWKSNTIMFEPDPGPDEFEDKLTKLLDFLEQDKEGVKRLVDEADGSILVAMEFHNGNTMLGGPHIDKESIQRMSALNLEIDFDLYVGGKPYL